MTNKNSKTLLYFQALGCEPYKILRSGDHGQLKKWASMLSDYELKYYHCKVLKMPLSTFDQASVINYMTYQAIFEYCQELEEVKQEAIREKQEAIRKDRRTSRIYKGVMVWYGVLCLLVIVLMFYLWLTIEC